MKQIIVDRDALKHVLEGFCNAAKQPLFRSLGTEAQQEYETTGTLTPQEGCLGVGRGVFFTNDPAYAIGFAKNTVLVTAIELLDPDQEAIDTRQPGYEQAAKEELDRRLGPGNYDGYTLWAEIQKQDTITRETKDTNSFVYTRRKTVKRDEIIAEITIIAG